MVEIAKSAVLVLGMHRSGTSVSTRLFNLLGCTLPKTLMQAHASNAEGHWESQVICEFNDRLLNVLGTRWDDWLPLSESWWTSSRYTDDLAEAVRALESEFGDATNLVLKDPRMCRLGLFWIEAVKAYGSNPVCIVPLRSPYEVAASLAQRDNVTTHHGLLLWLRHVLDVERATRGQNRAFFLYADLLDNPLSVLETISAKLGYVFPIPPEDVASDILATVKPGLRHHVEPQHQEPEKRHLPEIEADNWVDAVYGIVAGWCKGSKNADLDTDLALLDAIRTNVNEVSQSYGEVSNSMAVVGSALAAQDAQQQPEGANNIGEAPVYAKLVDALEINLNTLRFKLRESESRTAQLQEMLSQKTEEQQALVKVQRALQDRMAGMDAQLASAHADRDVQIAALKGRIAELESQVEQRREEVDQTLRSLDEERGKRAGVEAALADALAVQDTLKSKLVDADGWVLRLAEERQKNELALAALERRAGVAERASERANLAKQAEQKLSRNFEERLAEREKTFNQELEGLHARYERDMADQKRLLDEQVEKYKALAIEAAAHANADAEERIKKAEERLQDLDGKVRQSEASQKTIETKLSDRYRELAAMAEMVRERDARINLLAKREAWLEEVHKVLTSKPKWSSLLPAVYIQNIHKRRLQRRGLFDSDAYLKLNPDVALEGGEALRHYLLHGMGEGRIKEPNAS